MTMPTKPADGASWSSWGAFVDAFVRGATTVGKAVLAATDAAAARSAIGAGTASSKADVGLGNVDNTSDTSKPVSNATATAIASAITALKATVPTAVDHDGTTEGGTRPSGFLYVIWRGGTTRPTNMNTALDRWEHDA